MTGHRRRLVVLVVASAAAGVTRECGRPRHGASQPTGRLDGTPRSSRGRPRSRRQRRPHRGDRHEPGLPARAVTIAIATALQESKLRNISFGDRDSLGSVPAAPEPRLGHRSRRSSTRCTRRTRLLRRARQGDGLRDPRAHRGGAGGATQRLPRGIRPARRHRPSVRLGPDRRDPDAGIVCRLEAPPTETARPQRWPPTSVNGARRTTAHPQIQDLGGRDRLDRRCRMAWAVAGRRLGRGRKRGPINSVLEVGDRVLDRRGSGDGGDRLGPSPADQPDPAVTSLGVQVCRQR